VTASAAFQQAVISVAPAIRPAATHAAVKVFASKDVVVLLVVPDVMTCSVSFSA